MRNISACHRDALSRKIVPMITQAIRQTPYIDAPAPRAVDLVARRRLSEIAAVMSRPYVADDATLDRLDDGTFFCRRLNSEH
jgi:hypothetical protein